MRVVPEKDVDKLEFYERHISPWQTSAAGIGLLPADVTDLSTKTDAARGAFEAQQSAQDAAKAATLLWHNSMSVLAQAGSECIKKIRVKAATGGVTVYALAEIPAPAMPSPTPPPGKPSDFTVTLSDSGALNLKWKCANPAGTGGTIYQIYRRVGTADFTYIGGTGNKHFADNTLPAGSSAVTYQIQAVRSTAAGPWAKFNVNFGVSGGGAMTARVVETSPTKMAA